MTDETIRDLLIEIKTKVDILLASHSDHETRLRLVEQRPPGDPAVKATTLDHESRLRGVERKMWMLAGAATAAGTGGGAILARILGG